MEDKELNKDEVINEIVEENKVIEPVNAEVYEETEVKEDSKGLIFFKKILAGAIDQIISIALSLLLDFNLVTFLLGEDTLATMLVYDLVGISALVNIRTLIDLIQKV